MTSKYHKTKSGKMARKDCITTSIKERKKELAEVNLNQQLLPKHLEIC